MARSSGSGMRNSRGAKSPTVRLQTGRPARSRARTSPAILRISEPISLSTMVPRPARGAGGGPSDSDGCEVSVAMVGIPPRQAYQFIGSSGHWVIRGDVEHHVVVGHRAARAELEAEADLAAQALERILARGGLDGGGPARRGGAARAPVAAGEPMDRGAVAHGALARRLFRGGVSPARPRCRAAARRRGRAVRR